MESVNPKDPNVLLSVVLNPMANVSVIKVSTRSTPILSSAANAKKEDTMMALNVSTLVESTKITISPSRSANANKAMAVKEKFVISVMVNSSSRMAIVLPVPLALNMILPSANVSAKITIKLSMEGVPKSVVSVRSTTLQARNVSVKMV